MQTGFDKTKLLRYAKVATEHLSDPVKLRLAVVAALFIVTMVGVYLPLSKRIEQNKQRLSAERNRHQNITDVEKLRGQIELYLDRIGERSDTNEWVQYTLDGLRGFQVKLRDMESKAPRKVGPYRAITLSMEIEGTYPRLKDFLAWLEHSERILRVDSVRFEKRPDSLLMKVVVLGLVRKNVAKT